MIQQLEFSGVTYEASRDHDRLNAQLGRVRMLMMDGISRTLGEIAEATGDPESSVSARLRDLRKPKFGGLTVNRSYVGDGLWSYQVLLATQGQQAH